MLSMMISGPRQQKNDIDVYLSPLIEDLTKLWNEGVVVFDGYLSYPNFVRGLLFDDMQPLFDRFEVLGTLCCTIREVL